MNGGFSKNHPKNWGAHNPLSLGQVQFLFLVLLFTKGTCHS